MAVTELFRALGDPTRLKMMQRLSRGGPHTITTLSDGLHISRQGARKHLQLLVEAKVVTLHTEGRDTTVRLERKKLEEGRVFITDLEQRWDARLQALRRFVDGE